ncbi:putative disease resistance protein At3g14460 [Cajanus cajan]|uniref:putative disease resistance protein At3g14460 n=1 Tax=Cajanus cajan TaxID=3821 RepID=UPI00098DCFD8|nr:putative disease resistance protein At3g14460 [Cajanus cajan]XP_029125310.1 putative disease resistance protein At3g14460 [Cajanus cajan]
MVIELVCGALLSSFFQVLFDRLLSRHVLAYFVGSEEAEMLLNKLKANLLSINAVVDDAEQKQFSNSYVKAWLDEVKDALFDAEDLLDEMDYEASKYKVKEVSKFKLRINQVLHNLEVLSSQRDLLGLKNAGGVEVGSGSNSKVSQKLPSTSLAIQSVIYGRDTEKDIIFNWLKPDNANHLSILSIVGMGGVGKTTLVQHVYNDPRVKDAKFSIKAWVCISDNFDVLNVSRSILEGVTKSKDHSGDLEMIHGRLKKKLVGKKFLLVLDDVWNERRDKWEVVQTPLNCGAKGSVILVTTRSEKVASTMRSDKVHHLKQLREDYCWEVFADHALQHDNVRLNVELKKIGVKIVEKCKGLPLALKTIGSLLHTKSSISEWERVLTSKIWDLPKEDGEIIPALSLSYHNLPSHLKRCFAYCALFPKDYVFVQKNLIQLWMTENFLQCPQQSKTPEEIGKQYFDDLLARCFFEKSSKHETGFIMHDLLNDLAKYVCGDFCFRLGVDKAGRIPKTTRHFSFPINHNSNFDGFESLNDAKRLRTFMPTVTGLNSCSWSYKGSIICELSSKFKFLRHLSLSYYCNLKKVPDSIKNFKHLRSLDLSGTNIKILPDSICSLYNLQILKLNSCPRLEELPKNLNKLINLRHLEFIDTNVRGLPVHFENLKNLLVLSSFYVGKSSKCGIQQLGELNLHGRLSIGQLQNIEDPSYALAAYLKNKPHLVELALDWNQDWKLNDSRKENEVLENLQPSKHLEKLSISNYGGTGFPSWLIILSRVVSLSLVNCKKCTCIPPLGLLPSLKDLTIIGLDKIMVIDAAFYGSSSSSFTSLESLKFSDMMEWETWELNATAGAFPRLQHLSIKECPKLKGELPKQLLSLKTLNISCCRKLVASAPKAPKIHDLELENCGKLKFDYHPATLKRLTIVGQDMEESLLVSIEQMIPESSLEYLSIFNCPDMNISMGRCYHLLETLEIKDGSDSLRTFQLDNFPKLCKLYLKCRYLQKISQTRCHNHLRDLQICGHHSSELNLENPFASVATEALFPSEGLSAPSLKRLSIQRLENLKLLPQRMQVLLQSLDELGIEDCPNVELLPDGGLPSNLKRMDLSNCSKLIASLKGALRHNTSLEVLFIERVDVKFFPGDVFLPLSLTSLYIYGCPYLKQLDNKGLCHLSSLTSLYIYGCPYLKQLDYKGLCHLSSLKKLILRDCHFLNCLPKEGLPKSISTLEILGNCGMLNQRCQKPKGEDWGKINHIENVKVDIPQSELHTHQFPFI